MPEFTSQEVYTQPYDIVFNKAQEALKEMGAKIESADMDAGTVKASKKFQLFKKAVFIITFVKEEKGVKVIATSKMSALTMGLIDIGRNEKFLQQFFSNLYRKVNL